MIGDSPWEDVLLRFDVVVVGAGIIGLSSAIELAERNPALRIAVLERGLIPTGASTRNAGVACFGSVGEIVSDISRMGQKGALGVLSQRVAGLQKLKQRCASSDVGYEEHGGHELFFDEHEVLTHLPELNALLEPLLGAEVFTRRDDLINMFMLGPSVHALVHIKHEATIHSGLLMNTLWKKAEQLGVRIFTGSLVIAINGHQLSVRTINGERIVEAVTTVLATNGNTSQLTITHVEPTSNARHGAVAKHGAVSLEHVPTFEPARGQVLLTAPIEGLPLRGSFHFDAGFYYFRNLGNRILFGGGRNTDFEGERTLSMSTTQPLQEHLEELLRTVIAPGRAISIERRWSGTMAFANGKQPFVGYIAENVVLAFGCNGMGVALGSNIASDVADLIQRNYSIDAVAHG